MPAKHREWKKEERKEDCEVKKQLKLNQKGWENKSSWLRSVVYWEDNILRRKSKVDLDEPLNLSSASYSSASQLYQEDTYLHTSGAVFALTFLFFPWFEDCKDGRLQKERIS